MKKRLLNRLPVTFDDDAAMQFARGEIVRLKQPGSPWDESGAPLLSAESNSALMRRLFGHALHTAAGRFGVIELARTGNTDAQEVLRRTISEIDSRGLTMPDELKTYRNEVFAGTRYSKNTGRKKQDNIVRDLCIMLVVADLRKLFGIKPTLRSRRRRSGCAIVAEALDEAKMQRGEEAVRSIWKRYKHIAPI
jgi:hypothetical protein